MMKLGFDFYMRTEDRRIMETIILPYFAKRTDLRRVLFVGCAWYTRGYDRVFRGKDYWTIEVDATRAKYGSKKHVVDSVANLRRHFGRGEFDLIICNGVFGFGLNERADVERTFRACFECLREGGVLVHGWNDIPERVPFPLSECESLALFDRYVFPPLATAEYLTAIFNRHTYSFYVKSIPTNPHGDRGPGDAAAAATSGT
jgi:hypothetical protein